MQKKEFIIPDSVLAGLEESSGGSFLIFILNEDGQCVVYENHDTFGQEILTKSFAIDWLDADRQVRKEDMVDEIYEQRFANAEEEPDLDDDEGEEWKKNNKN